MKMVDAIKPTPQTRLAFIGIGGKMEAISRLAGQISGPVLLVALTHIGEVQLKGAGRHFVIRKPEDVTPLREPWQDGITLVTGDKKAEKEFGGLSIELLEELNDIAHSHNSPMLIIIEGSRNKPPIPGFVDTVIILASLESLGQLLSEDHVQISEHFIKLSGLKQGQAVTPEALVNVLTHPDGGLKNIPEGARRIVMLDQADTPEKDALARGMVKPLQKAYHIVLIGDLIQQQDEIKAVFIRVAGVILAAGESKRMKKPKQLLEWQGQTFVRVAADKALKVELDPVVVVTGAYRELVEEAVDGLPVKLVHNPLWKEGQSTSVKAGIDALQAGIEAVIFFLVDQPKIPINFIQTMIDTHATTLSPIIAPMVDHQRNNPVMFDRITFEDFSVIEGDSGGRQIFSKYQVTWLPWVDSSAFIDVDTEEDYQKLNEDM